MSVFWWKRTRTRINRQVLLVGGALDEADRTESIASSDWYSESSSIESLVVPELILAEQESLTVSGDYSDRVANLVEWNSVILLELLNRLVAQRQVVSTDPTTSTPKAAAKGILELTQTLNADTTPDSIMNEVVDIIEMPSFTTTSVPAIPASAHHKLSANVIQQLRQYVATMASLYNDNPFHNFEHASHVVLALYKFWSLIESPSVPLNRNMSQLVKAETASLPSTTSPYAAFASKLSDPLAQFSLTLAALIHDVDHPGVSNVQLLKESPPWDQSYHSSCRCMAEQHSIDVAWKELVSGDYPDLCVAIGFTTESERLCFRQLLVNAVVATDIMDAENCARQMQQWTVTFKDDNGCKSNAHAAEVLANRRATIAFELLMQASDISHYMQHWDIYQKWNQRLFDETKMAYHAGRSDKDPSTCWYQDELWFFDKCVIPLAHKLQKCGILGVLGGESLANALQNRHEFECMGQGVIQQYTKEYEEKYRR